MKTAEEWNNILHNADMLAWKEIIKKIQLDALIFTKSQIFPDGNPELAIERINAKIKELTNNSV